MHRPRANARTVAIDADGRGGGAIPARATHLPTSGAAGARWWSATPTRPRSSKSADARFPSRRMAISFGVGRDEKGPLVVKIKQPATGWIEHSIAVTPRDWLIENIRGACRRRR